jgi:glycosyltransferase involved in cell wall biosynthesis
VKNAILFTHINPVIHGQAMMANVLLNQSRSWNDVVIHPINAVYDEDRAKLRGFSFGKIARFWQYLLELQRLVCDKNARLLITTFAFFPGPFLKDCALVFFTRWILRCPVLVWVHMDPNRLDLEHRPHWLKMIAILLVRSIDGWVACAPSLSQSWPEWMKFKPIHEIANGIMDPAPQADQLATPGKHDTIRVVYISVIDEEKGWRELFSAAEIICREHSDVEFIFRGTIGINENETEVRGKFASSSFTQRIRFEGPVSGKEKSDLLRSADIFCLPSWTEAFPLAVLDAMAYGLPCLVTNVGAIREAIREVQEGCFFEPTNTHSLTGALNRMISDRDALARMGRSARLRFKEHFTSDAFADQWQQLLNSFQKRTS